MLYLGILIGLIIGTFFGIFLMCLLQINKVRRKNNENTKSL